MAAFEMLGERLQKLRTHLGKSQTEIAEEIGVENTTYSQYETGKANPSLKVIKAITYKYGISIDWLFGLSERMSLSGEITTYRELFQAFFDIESTISPTVINEWTHTYTFIDEGYPSDRNALAIGLGFFDAKTFQFFREWDEFKRLHDDGKVSNKLYEYWIKETLSKADEKIEK